MDDSPKPATQPQLDLDHSPAIETEMRVLFETRWARWHRAASYEEAVADPFTRRMLALTVMHSPSHTSPRRVRTKQPRKKPLAQPA